MFGFLAVNEIGVALSVSHVGVMPGAEARQSFHFVCVKYVAGLSDSVGWDLGIMVVDIDSGHLTIGVLPRFGEGAGILFGGRFTHSSCEYSIPNV